MLVVQFFKWYNNVVHIKQGCKYMYILAIGLCMYNTCILYMYMLVIQFDYLTIIPRACNDYGMVDTPVANKARSDNHNNHLISNKLECSLFRLSVSGDD